jgi:hypothetical protein
MLFQSEKFWWTLRCWLRRGKMQESWFHSERYICLKILWMVYKQLEGFGFDCTLQVDEREP